VTSQPTASGMVQVVLAAGGFYPVRASSVRGLFAHFLSLWRWAPLAVSARNLSPPVASAVGVLARRRGRRGTSGVGDQGIWGGRVRRWLCRPDAGAGAADSTERVTERCHLLLAMGTSAEA
jgi:hypothetical protein